MLCLKKTCNKSFSTKNFYVTTDCWKFYCKRNTYLMLLSLLSLFHLLFPACLSLLFKSKFILFSCLVMASLFVAVDVLLICLEISLMISRLVRLKTNFDEGIILKHFRGLFINLFNASLHINNCKNKVSGFVYKLEERDKTKTTLRPRKSHSLTRCCQE